MRVRAKPKHRNAAGEVVPSVTTALGILGKPALIRWANKLGLQGIDSSKYVDVLADIGTLTHYLILCRLQEEVPEVDDYTPEQVRMAEVCFKQYVEWEDKNPVMAVFTERSLVSEKYQYGGTIDLYGVCNKELLLVDFKTSNSGIFPEMIFQVSAYYHLLLENGYRVSKAVILRIGRSGLEGAEEKIILPYELENGFEIFARCLDIYQLRRNQPAVCTELR